MARNTIWLELKKEADIRYERNMHEADRITRVLPTASP